MSKTSIHISPVKSSSEVHNFRDKDLDYVRKDLTHLNESWSCESIQSRLSTIKDKYKATTGQTMQKKAVPIREGVAVIDNNTTMEQLKDFANKCHERFGFTVFQIHIHRDEGHRGSLEWKPNLHAHLVIDWTDSSGKSIKTKRQDFAQMQTLLAESLGMERGQSSDRKHLDSIQYKTEAKAEALNNVIKELDQVQSELNQAKKDLKNIESKKDVQKTILKASEKLRGIIGVTVNDKEKELLQNENKTLKEQNEKLKEENEKLNKTVSEQRNEISHKQETISMKNRIIGKKDTEILNYKKEIEKLPDFLTPQQLQKIVAAGIFPMLSKFMAISNEGNCL